MGVTKAGLFSEKHNQMAAIAKAMAHPARMAIIELLLEKEGCACGFFVEEIGLAQPTISQHLKELKAVGIIQGSVEGASVCYCINPEKWEEITNLFRNLFEKYNSRPGSCC